MIRVWLPAHLRTLARTGQEEVELEVEPPVTLERALDVLEARYPMLQGTLRDHETRVRRPFIRFYADEQDLSLADPATAVLPPRVLEGEEPLLVVGAIAGGL